jgi:hypothetical protein
MNKEKGKRKKEKGTQGRLTGCRKAALRLALPFSFFLFPFSFAQAELDPGLKTPYHLRIVLHVAEHRLLTPTFQERLEHELRDHLRLSYGKLAKVEVVRAHPLLKDVRAKGLTAALDGWNELSDVKTHFVLIDYLDGHYRVRARQHDGLTGLASPVVRRGETGERRLVALTAARLVDRDFGLSGTVTKVEGDHVEVSLRGGGLGVPLGRWVRSGNIFAVARITEEAGKPRAARMEWVLLQAADEPQNGICPCRLFHRWKGALQEEPGVLGYRCLALTTTDAPLRLRLVDDKTGAFLNGVRVHVGATGFEDKGWERTTGLDGLIVTPESYRSVAFVRVFSGGTLRAQFPVEIVDDGSIKKCPVNLTAEAVEAGQFQMRRERWLRRTYESLRVVASRFADLNAALERSPEAALEMARRGEKAIGAELLSLADERDQLLKSAAKVPGGLDLSEGEPQLQQLQEQRARLAAFMGRLDAMIKEANSPETKALQTKLERARLLEAEADFDGAIRLYEEVLAKRPDEKQVAAQLAKLKAAWRIKDGDTDHTAAREFLYNTWPRLDTAGVKTDLARAVKAFAVCRDRRDLLTPERLVRTNLVHAVNLKNRLDVLRRARDSEDNHAEMKALVRVAEGLRDLQAEVRTFLRKGKSAEKAP